MHTDAGPCTDYLKDYCRICGKLLSCNRLHLFLGLEPSLREKIFKILPYKILKEDKLPKNCCNKCKDILNEFIIFIDKSWNIQRAFLKKVNIEEHEPNKALELPLKWYEDDFTKEQETPTVVENVEEEGKKTSVVGNLKVIATETQSNVEEKDKENTEVVENEETIVIDPEDVDCVVNENVMDEVICGDGEITTENKNEAVIEKTRESTSQSEVDKDSTSLSSQDLDEKEKTKQKIKFRKKNPFCLPSRKKKYNTTRKSISTEKSGKKTGKRRAEAEKLMEEATELISDTKEHYGQLYVNGEITLIEVPPQLNGENFVLFSVPQVGIIYLCRKCEVIYTTVVSALGDNCAAIQSSSGSESDSDDDFTPKKSYPCTICSAAFPRRVTLDHHMESHFHTEESEEEIIIQRKPRKRKKPRYSSDSSVNISISESSESEITSVESAIDSDDFIVYDEETTNRRRLKDKKRPRVRQGKRSTNKAKQYFF